jgi:tetratricopeptide (TPR) repeat protein
VLSLEERQLRSWERQGLIDQADEYAFSDLVALRTLNTLREKKIPAQRIRKSLASLRQRLRHVKNPWTEVKIFADGKRIGVQFSGQRFEPVSGQMLLDFEARAEAPRELPARSEPVRSREQADYWFAKGLEIEQSGGRPEEAAEAYLKAVEMNPGSAGALVNLGTIYFHKRDWARSEYYYKAAVAADPNYALAHYNLGNYYDERNDTESAARHYYEALRIQPQYADAHYNLALLHQGEGDTMQALSHWQHYLKLDGGSQWAQIARRELAKIKQSTVVPGVGPQRV